MTAHPDVLLGLGRETELPPEFTEEAIALEFARKHETHLRYVPEWRKWLVWNGKRWEIDGTNVPLHLCRRICRETAVRASKVLVGPSTAKIVKALASAHTVEAVQRLIKADPRLVATTGQWDLDLFSLNTPV